MNPYVNKYEKLLTREERDSIINSFNTDISVGIMEAKIVQIFDLASPLNSIRIFTNLIRADIKKQLFIQQDATWNTEYHKSKNLYNSNLIIDTIAPMHQYMIDDIITVEITDTGTANYPHLKIKEIVGLKK